MRRTLGSELSRTLFDGQNKQTEYESKLSICEHAGESTVPKELTSFSAPPLHKGGNLLANLQLRVFVSPFYQMARGVHSVDREAVDSNHKGSWLFGILNRLDLCSPGLRFRRFFAPPGVEPFVQSEALFPCSRVVAACWRAFVMRWNTATSDGSNCVPAHC